MQPFFLLPHMYLLFETSPGWLQDWRVFLTSIWWGSTQLQCIYYLRRILISRLPRVFRRFKRRSCDTWHLSLWVSLLTPIHSCVPSLIFGPLMAKYLAKNGVSGTFLKNYWLNSFHTWHLSLWGESLDLLYIFVFLASFSALWWPNICGNFFTFPKLFT